MQLDGEWGDGFSTRSDYTAACDMPVLRVYSGTVTE